MGKRALTDEQEQKLLVDHQDGFTIPQLAERFQVSQSTVNRVLAYHKAPLARPRTTAKRRTKTGRAEARSLKPCGTNAAYARHKKNGEYPCTPCLEAHAAQQAAWIEGKNA